MEGEEEHRTAKKLVTGGVRGVHGRSLYPSAHFRVFTSSIRNVQTTKYTQDPTSTRHKKLTVTSVPQKFKAAAPGASGR